mgnify:FL=1|tara:strand:+ start:72 stop:320 length:249 start_codon:yes stop_codon:yes gene_type:complete
MALDKTNFKKVGGAGDQNLWLYHSTDAVGTVAGSGYFNDMTNGIQQDDIILVVGATGGTRTVDMLVVTSASGAATVTTTNGT